MTSNWLCRIVCQVVGLFLHARDFPLRSVFAFLPARFDNASLGLAVQLF